MICEQIPNKGLSAGNVSTRYVEELMRVRKFKSFGKIQGGHAHFWPWEFYVKNSKSLYINNHGMWVLHTHVFWHGKSIYNISFTLRPSPDPFLTTPMPYRGIFFAKNSKFPYINNHNMWVLYSHVFWHEKSIYTTSFTLKPSPDPFLTSMPYRGNFRIYISILQ